MYAIYAVLRMTLQKAILAIRLSRAHRSKICLKIGFALYAA